MHKVLNPVKFLANELFDYSSHECVFDSQGVINSWSVCGETLMGDVSQSWQHFAET